jgi:hypothetical protein
MVGFSRCAGRFFQARQGAVAVIFALAAVPMLAVAGLSMDFANTSGSRSAANSMIDSAAVAAATAVSRRPELTPTEARTFAEETAKREFYAHHSSKFRDWQLQEVSFAATSKDNTIEIRICYEAQQPTTILRVLNITSMPFAACATAQSAPPTYVSVYALVDASGSMGIGATQADQRLMETRLGCAFACHTINDVNDRACNTPGATIPRNWWSQTPKCTKAIGATTRFDVVRNALAQVASQAQELQRVPQQYQISIHKFSNYLTEVHALTSAMPSARNALDRMVMDQRGGGSNFYKVMADFTRLVPASGDGRSLRSPKVYVLLMTDGIGSRVFEENRCFFGGAAPCLFEGRWRHDPDYVLESPFVDGGIRSQAFPARLCDDLKRKGATVLTLATEFDSSGINDNHMKNVDRTLRVRSLDGLSRCASATNLAFRANHGPDVERAIRQMFSSVVETARLIR